ncbi:MAG: hypothetical protein FWC60_08950 [Firmicutes bacterium]|nr:hypothetical protein [Bacillota bacterium]
MDLLNYRGFNCHLACVVNMAAALGVNYPDAFVSLWSEREFTDYPPNNIYISKRVFANLDALGTQTEIFNCASPAETAVSLSLIPDGELFFVGLESFYIPWHPLYQHFYNRHYFFARMEQAEYLTCFDPIFNQKDVLIKFADIAAFAYDLGYLRLAAAKPLPALKQVAREILVNHPPMQKYLQSEILKCEHRPLGEFAPLIKLIDALIGNRYMFQLFLHQSPAPFTGSRQFFDGNFLGRWDAVKSGLYKAYILKDKEKTVNEVSDLFVGLIREEIALAKEIIGMD